MVRFAVWLVLACGRDDHREDRAHGSGRAIHPPRAERSAVQASASRGEKMRARKPLLPPGALIETPAPEEPLLPFGVSR